MFETLFRFIARHVALPILVRLRQPPVARLIQAISRALRLSPPPPREAVPFTRQWVERTADDGRALAPVRPAERLQLEPPKSIEPSVHWIFRERMTFETQPTFSVRVPRGSVHGAYGSVTTGDGVILGDLSLEWFFKPEQHSLLFKMRLPGPRHLDGTAASVAAASGWNYFHWLLDVLPRFGILRQAGWNLELFDWFILNSGNAAFQKESLDWLGIPVEKRVFTARGTHLTTDQLIVPSLPGIPSQTPPWVVDFLKQTFPASIEPSTKQEKLYISRSRSRYRTFTNEAEVRAFLLERGFREIFAEELSFREQVNLFASASVIVAPHGAGLSNLVFCRPGTRVIEIFSPSYVNGCFWVIANWAKLDYYYLIGEGTRPPEFHDPHRVEQNITVNLPRLKATFQLAGLE